MKKRIATFDIETDALYPEATKVWCIAIKDHQDGLVSLYNQDHISDGLCALLRYDCLVGHNSLSFDFPVLRKLYGWEFHGQKIDTLIMSRTQRVNRRTPKGSDSGPHSVESWGVRLGRAKVANDVWDTFSPIILERCKEDVEIQYQIYEALLEEGSGEGWEHAHRLNMKLFEYLQRQEEYGWTLDIAHLHSNIRTLNRWIDRINNVVYPQLPWLVDIQELKKDGEYKYVSKPFKKDGSYTAITDKFISNLDIPDSDKGSVVAGPFSRVDFRRVDLDSIKETKDYLLSLGWVPDQWNENDDGEQTSPKFSKDDHFIGIQSGLGKLIAKRIQCRQRLSVLEGWKALLRPDGRVSTPVSGIASTGRLRHKEIVNIPSPHSKAFFAKQMRQVFIAKPGWVLVGVDSKGNQIRQLAARMNDDEFTQAVLFGNADEGTDLHSLNQRRSGAPSRSKAKNFFYGFIFGAGARKIATTIGITFGEAKVLIERYLHELPGLARLIDKLTNQWRETAQKWYNKKENRWVYANGYITGLDGRPIQVDSEHKVLCYALQSDEAIQMAVAYVMFNSWMDKEYKFGEDWGMLIWVHDEFQFECKPEIKDHSAELACKAIKWAGEYLKIGCPHDGESKFGRNWYETH